jgi:hypothetical protein
MSVLCWVRTGARRICWIEVLITAATTTTTTIIIISTLYIPSSHCRSLSDIFAIYCRYIHRYVVF